MHHRFVSLLLLSAILLPGTVVQASDEAAPPIADVHLHWKWNQKEATTIEQALSVLDNNQVRLAVVTGTPPELALELAEADPNRIIAIWGPYRLPGQWVSWHRDDKLLENARAALASGRYQGIGEIHMIGGFISDWRHPNIQGLFKLGAEFDAPVLVHTEFSRGKYVREFCAAHPDTTFLWAHAGSALKIDEIDATLAACPNLWLELSARDPWRHVSLPISDESGRLVPAWRALVLKYADRTVIGSDPVWPVDQLNPWDEPDTGWHEIHRFLDFHRTWIDGLPDDVQSKIRLDNALRLFKRASADPSPARH